jgi:predicted N-acetyltransferase YhbS
MEKLLNQLRVEFPSVDIDAYESKEKIELMNIKVPKEQRGMGIGTNIIQRLQKYAAAVGKPIVLRPQPEKGYKQALDKFYKTLGFVKNKGRNIDYSLSSPTASTMYWRFKEWVKLTDTF